MRDDTQIAPKTGMRILWGEVVLLPCGGVGEWVVSGNEGLTEEGVFVVFCLCMYVWCIRQGQSIVLNEVFRLT